MKQAPKALLLLTFSLSACAVGPDYHPIAPPDKADTPLVSAQASVADSSEPPDDWWQLYDDPLLTSLVKEALTANDDLKAAEANLAGARALFEASRAGLFPRTGVNLGATYGRDALTDEILELGGHKPETIWIFDDVFDMSYELDLFGHVRRSIEGAQAGAEAIIARRDAVRVTVAAETARAYAEICAVGEEIAVARRSLDLVTREATITARRRAAGAGSDFDVVRAEAVVERARAAIPPLQARRQTALFELGFLLGRAPGNPPSGADSCVSPPILKTVLPVGDGAALLRRRPDIRAAERRLAASTAGIGVATADLYPRISLGVLYGGVSTAINQLGSENALTWAVGPTINWNFPIQAGPRARVKQAKAAAAADLALLDEAVLRALKEAEQALTSYKSEIDHHAALIALRHKARRAFELAHGQFAAGAVSQLDFLTSEESLIAADSAVAAADTAMAQDQIAVFKALGGGWN